jgi:hypothetical protein
MSHDSSEWNLELQPRSVSHPIREEAAELKALANSLIRQAPHFSGGCNELKIQLDRALAAANHPFAAELSLETFTQNLRHSWLETAISAASQVYRSPTANQTAATASGTFEDFGYERDLQPTTLERRCHAFFGLTTAPWIDDHILYSSGQAATTAALLMLDTVLKAPRPFKVAHLGSYFETVQLLSLSPSLFRLLPEKDFADADLLIVEPIACNGHFSQVNMAHLIESLGKAAPKERVILIDDTLRGASIDSVRLLSLFNELNPLVLFRLSSGLKLFQAGLELGSVGILSVYTQNRLNLSGFCKTLREIRTLCGVGLQFFDVAALDVPWFLDRHYTALYENAVFAHNRQLAVAVAMHSRLFDNVFHPSMCQPPGKAPYCVFRLMEASDRAYDRLEQRLKSEAAHRQLLFEQGGSFGFRGHRFDIVRPDNGEPSFLRVAMGRRTGWSFEGIVQMMCDLSAESVI